MGLMMGNKTHNFYKKYGKRALDLAIVLPSVILLLPVYLVICLMIKLDSKGPIIYSQARVGKNGMEFPTYKFRTMVVNADKIGPLSTETDDQRITRIGKILRKTSLDELPQLINVLIGNMSLIGPRPGLKVHLDMYSDQYKDAVLSVKPGITGLAQIKGRSSLSLEEKVYFDEKYVAEVSFVEDVNILINTIRIVLLKKGTN